MKKYIAILSAAIVAFSSCEKSFDVANTEYLTGNSAASMVEQDPEFLSSYVGGLYSFLVSYGGAHDDFGYLSTGYILDMMGQDIAINGSWNWGTYDINHDYGLSTWGRCRQFWSTYYTLINNANEIIDFFGEEDPKNEILRGYLGQAYALRALAYTMLVQIFQDPVTGTTPGAQLRTDAPAVPLIFATRDGRSADEADQFSGRNKISDVMAHIEENLELALPLLKGYNRASKNEVNYQVAQGFAARYYLLTQQWDKAAAAAKEAQSGFTIMNESRLYSGFMEIEDPEVIWGFNHSTETMTSWASFFSHLSNDSGGYGGGGQSVHCIDVSLYDMIPDTDYRKGLFNTEKGDPSAVYVGAQLPFASRKFGYAPQWLQDYIYMRASEMILIEAEAYARQGNGSQAAATLKPLMAQRDPAWAQSSVTVDDILLQRRIELWGEGFEYFDLRRNGLGVDRTYQGSNHMAAAKYVFEPHESSWNFQIPKSEINENPNITEDDQNEWVSPVE